MTTYFLDTSAIIKRYFPEQGHSWIVDIHDSAKDHDLYISQVALVEVVASICRKAREQDTSASSRDALINTFRRDCQRIYGLQRVTTTTYTKAGNLCRVHKL